MQNNFPKIPFILSLLFFIFSCGLFVFLFREVHKNDLKSQMVMNEWQKEEQKRDEISSLNRSLKMIDGEKNKLATHFVQSSDIVPFLNTVEALAPKVGVSAEIVYVDTTVNDGDLLLGINVLGNFSGIYKFITLLENSPYEINFISMDLNRKDEIDLTKPNNLNPEWVSNLRIKLLSFIK